MDTFLLFNQQLHSINIQCTDIAKVKNNKFLKIYRYALEKWKINKINCMRSGYILRDCIFFLLITHFSLCIDDRFFITLHCNVSGFIMTKKKFYAKFRANRDGTDFYIDTNKLQIIITDKQIKLYIYDIYVFH